MLNPVSEKYEKLLSRICETSTKTPLSGRKSSDYISLWEFCKEKGDLSDEFEKNLKISGTAYKSVNKIGSERGISKPEVILKLIKATCLTRGWEGLDQFVENYVIATSDRKIDAFENFDDIVQDIRDKAKKDQSKSDDEQIEQNPYRGIHAFKEEDSKYFFGRDQEINDLCERIEQSPFVAVIGASGSGKSSLIHAGVIPKLREMNNFVIKPFEFDTTGDKPNPFQALASALVPLLYPDEEITDQIKRKTELANNLENGEAKLGVCLDTIYEINSSEKILLVIDQFEDIFTPDIDEEIRKKFLGVLNETIPVSYDKKSLSRSSNATLLINIRRDFLDLVENKYIQFYALINVYRNDISVIGKEGLTQIIVEPAKLYEVEFEEKLVEAILEDYEKETSSIFLIENALTMLWNKRDGSIIKRDSYLDIGRIYGALDKQVDKDYNDLNINEKKRAEIVFVKLIRQGKDGSPSVKQRVKKEDFSDDQWAVVQKIAGKSHRLIVIDNVEQKEPESSSQDKQNVSQEPDEKVQETAELAHDKLITEWTRLKEWLENNAEFKIWQESLKANTEIWLENKDNFIEGEFLKEAENNKDDHRLTANQKLFIEESIKENNKRVRRKSAISIISFISLLVFISLSGFLYISIDEVKEKEKIASSEKNRAIENSNRLLLFGGAGMSSQGVEKGHENRLAILLILSALEGNKSKAIEKEAEIVLHNLVGKYAEYLNINYKSNIRQILKSPDEKFISAITHRGDLIIHRADSKEIIREIKSLHANMVEYSFNGKYLAIDSLREGVVIYNLVDDEFTGSAYCTSKINEKYPSIDFSWLIDSEILILKCSGDKNKSYFHIVKPNKKEKNMIDTVFSATSFKLYLGKSLGLFYEEKQSRLIDLKSGETKKHWSHKEYERVEADHSSVYVAAKKTGSDWVAGYFDEKTEEIIFTPIEIESNILEGSKNNDVKFDIENKKVLFISDNRENNYSYDFLLGATSIVKGVPEIYNPPNYLPNKKHLNKNLIINRKSKDSFSFYKKINYPKETKSIYNIFNIGKNILYGTGVDFEYFFSISGRGRTEFYNFKKNKHKMIYDMGVGMGFDGGSVYSTYVAENKDRVLFSTSNNYLIVFNPKDGKVLKAFQDVPRSPLMLLSNDEDKVFMVIKEKNNKKLFFDYNEVSLTTGEVLNVNKNYLSGKIKKYSKSVSEILSSKNRIFSNRISMLENLLFINDGMAYSYLGEYWGKINVENGDKYINVTKNGQPYVKIKTDFEIEMIKFSRNEKYILGQGDKKAIIYDASTGEEISRFDFRKDIYLTSISNDSKNIIIQLGNHTLQVFEMHSKNLIFDYYSPLKISFLNTSLDSSRIAWVEGGEKFVISPLELYQKPSIKKFFRSLELPPIKQEEMNDLFFDLLIRQGSPYIQSATSNYIAE